IVVGHPERRLVNPIRFFKDSLAKTERFEHFHRAARNSVGLAEKQRPRFLFNNASLDVGKSRELSREGKAGRSGPDDQDVHFHGRGRQGLGGLKDMRIAWSKSVKVKLHGLSL